MTKTVNYWTLAGVTLLTISAAPAQTANTAFGTNAGASVTTGDFNSFFGFDAGRFLSSGSRNTVIGEEAGVGLLDTTVGERIDTGAVLTQAFNGSEATLMGYRAGWMMTTGFDNTFIGHEAGSMVTDAGDNTFIGCESGELNTTGYDNTFVGEESGANNTTGYENVFIGEDAGFSNTTGYKNVFVGNESGISTDVGYLNTGVGDQSLSDVDDGYMNVAMGANAGIDIGDGVGNIIVGAQASPSTEWADFNTIIGCFAGWDNNRTNSTTNANRNTYVGAGAGYTNREGEDNLILGAFSGGARWTDTSAASFAAATAWLDQPTGKPGGSTNVSRRLILGSQAIGASNDSFAIGYFTESTALRAMAIGNIAKATHEDSIVIGYDADSHGPDIMVLGNDDLLSIDPDADGVTALGSGTFRYSEVNAKTYNALADAATPANMTFVADAGTQNDDSWRLQAADSGAFTIASFATGAYVDVISAANNGDVTVAGDVNVNSDGRLKEQVEPIGDALTILEKVQGKTYHWKPETGRDDRTHYGLIAQEVEAAVPELVSTRESDGIKSVNYQGFVPILINAVDELKEQNQKQSEEIALLREQIALQKQLLEKLAAQ